MIYPIIYKIKGKRVVVIGAGQVALRKIKDLVNAGAQCVVIAPEIHPDLQTLAQSNPSIKIVNRSYQKGDCRDAVLVFSATNNPDVNKRVYEEASKLNIPINSVDDPENSSFYVPSFFTRGMLLVAVSTGGASPAMAAKIRRHIENAIPQDIEIILDTMQEIRKLLKENYAHIPPQQRGDILKAITNEDILNQAVAAYNNNALHDFLDTFLNKK